MAITQGVVDAVCEHAAGRRVHSVRVEVGALCAVVPDSMQFCFDLVTEGEADTWTERLPPRAHASRIAATSAQARSGSGTAPAA